MTNSFEVFSPDIGFAQVEFSQPQPWKRWLVANASDYEDCLEDLPHANRLARCGKIGNLCVVAFDVSRLWEDQRQAIADFLFYYTDPSSDFVAIAVVEGDPVRQVRPRGIPQGNPFWCGTETEWHRQIVESWARAQYGTRCKEDAALPDASVQSAIERFRESKPHGVAVRLLMSAARILENPNTDPERACWRVADALLLLAEKFPDATGVAKPTGRGAQLSKSAKESA